LYVFVDAHVTYTSTFGHDLGRDVVIMIGDSAEAAYPLDTIDVRCRTSSLRPVLPPMAHIVRLAHTG